MPTEAESPPDDRIQIVGWDEFQHYSDRNPPWIKLHRSLLDNREWRSLDHFSARLLIELWLLASETHGGWVKYASEVLAWRLRYQDASAPLAVAESLETLADKGFVELHGEDASAPLADCYQDASKPLAQRERERQRGEREAESEDAPPSVVESSPTGESSTPSVGSREAPEIGTRRNGTRPEGLPEPLYELAHAEDPTEGEVTKALVGAWLDLQPTRPHNDEIAKQGRAAKWLAERHSPAEIALAFLGLQQMFPHSEGEPWDIMTLKQKFPRAMQAFQKHPEVKSRKRRAELRDAIAGEGP